MSQYVTVAPILVLHGIASMWGTMVFMVVVWWLGVQQYCYYNQGIVIVSIKYHYVESGGLVWGSMVLLQEPSIRYHGVEGSSNGGLEWGSKKCDRVGPPATRLHRLDAASRNNMFSPAWIK